MYFIYSEYLDEILQHKKYYFNIIFICLCVLLWLARSWNSPSFLMSHNRIKFSYYMNSM